MQPKVKLCSGAKYSSRNLTFFIYLQINVAGKIPYITLYLLETNPALQMFKKVANLKTLALKMGVNADPSVLSFFFDILQLIVLPLKP